MTPQQAQSAPPATKEDLRESERHIYARIAESNAQTNARITETNAQTNARIDELRADMNALRNDLKADMRMFFGAVIGIVGVMVSVTAGVFIAVAL